MSNRSTDIAIIQRRIHETRVWLRCASLAVGVLATVGLLVMALLLITWTDVVVPLQGLMRVLGFSAIAASALWALVVGVVRPLFHRLPDVTVARRMEARIPGIRNRLVSCVDLADANGAHAGSPAFHQRLIAETTVQLRGFSARNVVDVHRVRHALGFAATGLLALLLSLVLFQSRVPTAVARVLQPWKDIPPASHLAYDVLVGDRREPGDCEVLEGDEIVFTVVLHRGEADRPGGPDSLCLDVDTVDDHGRPRRLRYPFPESHGGRTQFQLAGMWHAFAYRVRGGRTWTPKYQVMLLSRPRIASVAAVIHFPAYMRTDPLRKDTSENADIEAPVGSTIELVVGAEGDAVEGHVELLPLTDRVAGQTQHAARIAAQIPLHRWDEGGMEKDGSIDSPEVDSFAAKETGATSDHAIWVARFLLEQDSLYHLVLQNRVGDQNRPMRDVRLTALADTPPIVRIERPRRELAVSEPVAIPILASVADDFGVSALQLFARAADENLPEPNSLASGGRRQTLSKTPAADPIGSDAPPDSGKLSSAARLAQFGGSEVRQPEDSARLTTRAVFECGVQTWSVPVPVDSVVISLDLASLPRRPGKSLLYWLRAIDSKGQASETAKQKVRINDARNSMDESFATFLSEIETIQADLEKLIAAQSDVRQSARDLAVRQTAQQKDLAALTRTQSENTDLGHQIAEALTTAAERAFDAPWLPEEVINHLETLDRAFEPMALDPMQTMGQMLEEAKSENAAPSLLTDFDQTSAELLQNLNDLRSRIQALARAQQPNWQEMEQAVAELEKNLFRQDVRRWERELAELQECVESLREDLQQLQDMQEQLLERTKQERDRTLESMVQEQSELDRRIGRRLAEANDLLGADPSREMQNTRSRPSVSSDGMREAGVNQPGEGMLGADGESESQSDAPWTRLQPHQREQIGRLRDTKRSLLEARGDLEQLMGRYQQTMPTGGMAEGTSEQQNELAELIRSEATQNAAAMLRRMRRIHGSESSSAASDARRRLLPLSPGTGQHRAPPGGVQGGLLEFSELDATTRAALLEMQPRAREQLLQAFREKGPEGYRRFIRDYFRRLTHAGRE